MRSTTFALLGIMAAMALGLVAMVSSQGVPVLPGLPLPGLSTERDRVEDARAIATPGPAQGLGPAAEAPVAESGGGGAEPKRTDSSSLSGSRQLATAKNPSPTDPGADGTPTDEAPVVPVPAAPPPVEAPATAPAPQPAPAAPAVGTPPGKATAVVDASQNDDGENARGDEPKTQEKRDARGGRAGGGTGRGESSPVTPPSQAQDDADTQDEGADEASSQAEIDEDRGRGGSRGHGYRRFGR